MKNKVLTNVLLNATSAVLFVSLNSWALSAGLEETFISFAMLYGITTVLINAVFVAKVK